MAHDSYSHDIKDLPAAAQTVLKNYFKSKVSVIKIDKDYGRVSEYEVVLTDGCQVTFDKSGNWKEIETSSSSSVPAKIVPKAIIDWVKTNQKRARIIGIERTRGGFDVELSNGVDVEFNRNGGFVSYDD